MKTKVSTSDCLRLGPFQIYVDGAGQQPDGKGSGYAFLNQTTGKTGVKWVDGLTNNEAEYRAVRYALCNIPRWANAEILSDSQLVVNQFNRQWAINDPKLRKCVKGCWEIVEMHRLRVTLKWVPREQNLADGLLRRHAK
jgi:ribonuclease HI